MENKQLILTFEDENQKNYRLRVYGAKDVDTAQATQAMEGLIGSQVFRGAGILTDKVKAEMVVTTNELLYQRP